MSLRVIANPPIGIYTNPKIHIGHAFFLVLLDTIARHKSKKGEKVVFPSRSYNFFGKRGDMQALKEGITYPELKRRHLKTIEDDMTREKLNLFSLELLIDDDPQISAGVIRDLKTLQAKDYVFDSHQNLYLNCPKISKDFDLRGGLRGITFRPVRIKKEMERLIMNNLSLPILISRDTDYSVNTPDHQRVGPLTVLAMLWDYKYPQAEYTFAGSNSILSKYTFLRHLLRTSLDGSPGMDELVVWPKIVPEGGVESWNLDELIKNKNQGDMARHFLLSAYSDKSQKVCLRKGVVQNSRNFIHRLLNLGIPLKGSYDLPSISKGDCRHMENMRFKYIFDSSQDNLKKVSIEINAARSDGSWTDHLRHQLASRYMYEVQKLSPMLPEITRQIEENMK